MIEPNGYRYMQFFVNQMNKVNNMENDNLKNDVMNNVGGYPWLTIEICNAAKSNDDIDAACKYLRSCATKKGYNLGINESFDVFDKHCS